jgi:hypothetical protein
MRYGRLCGPVATDPEVRLETRRVARIEQRRKEEERRKKRKGIQK